MSVLGLTWFYYVKHVEPNVEEYLEMKSRQETKEVTTKQKNLVYVLEGIKTLFGCSTTTVWRIKNSEWIRPAINQVGRKIRNISCSQS